MPSYQCVIKINNNNSQIYFTKDFLKMDHKLQRYMQRIDKIISIPNRTASPIRNTRSPFKCRTNQLDQYLKYELSAKIINNIFQKHHQQLTILFFNLIRRAQNRQRERVYKFITIQKSQIKVDSSISAKLLVSVLKEITKKRYIQFMQNLKSINQPKLVENLPRRRQTMQSAILLRGTSQTQRKNVREISQWKDDIVSKDSDLPNNFFQNMKKMSIQNLIKPLKYKFKNSVEFAFRRIKGKYQLIKNISKVKNEQASNYQEKQKAFKKELQRLANELAHLKQYKHESEKSIAEKEKDQGKEQIFQQLSLLFKQSYMKSKTKMLNNVKSMGIHRSQQKKNKKIQQKCSNHCKSTLILHQFYHKMMKNYFSSLQNAKKGKTMTSQTYRNFVFIIDNVLRKKNLQSYHNFWSKLQLSSIIFERQSKIQEKEKERMKQVDKPIFKEEILTPKLMQSKVPETTVSKINFYSFVDKIFKLILILSKLLIPMKEAFVKIDLYASYSYRIEEPFKVVSQKCLLSAFESIKNYKIIMKTESILRQESKINPNYPLIDALQKIAKERMVQSFSHIKIVSKSKQLNDEIPIDESIIEMTKQFINERNSFSQHSLEYWSKFKNTFFQQSNIEGGEQVKKRSSNK